MNDTRKAIIELIEPFMEKDLVKGCYLQNKQNLTITLFDNVNNTIKDKKQAILNRDDIIKILGHYDISAVFMFFANKVVDEVKIYLHGSTIDVNTHGRIVGQFPNKPLHLYIEQEEKDLLKLLQELNKSI